MNSNGQADFQYQTYPTGGVFMEERFYSFTELRSLLKAEEIMNRHAQASLGMTREQIRKAQEK
jgi:hypothetical protein